MAPPAKKQKTSNGLPKVPVTFTTPGIKPDVRLYVFNEEFHVNSAILKHHSSFFRSMLDPSGGKMPTSTSLDFHSDWFTRIDDDDAKSWSLSSDVNVSWTPFVKYLQFSTSSNVQFERMLTTLEQLKDLDLSHFKGDVSREAKAFQNILCAIFGREYSITDAAELNIMTIQADYYRALPVLSNSISGTFFHSPGLVSSVGKDPCSLLVSAYKLRHKVLFRESLIYVLGPWSNPRYTRLSDPVLRNLATKKNASLNSRVLEAHQGIVLLASELIPVYSSRSLAKQLLNFAPECTHDSKVLYPKFFRLCYERIENNEDRIICPLFSRLLANQLVLNSSAAAGTEDFADFFLCCEVKDDELPWDITQTDW
jgi:hypothetical protein